MATSPIAGCILGVGYSLFSPPWRGLISSTAGQRDALSEQARGSRRHIGKVFALHQ